MMVVAFLWGENKPEKTRLTIKRSFHPGEGDPPDDALAEAQQERAALFLLQQQLLFTFAQETHDVAERRR